MKWVWEYCIRPSDKYGHDLIEVKYNTSYEPVLRTICCAANGLCFSEHHFWLETNQKGTIFHLVNNFRRPWLQNVWGHSYRTWGKNSNHCRRLFPLIFFFFFWFFFSAQEAVVVLHIDHVLVLNEWHNYTQGNLQNTIFILLCPFEIHMFTWIKPPGGHTPTLNMHHIIAPPPQEEGKHYQDLLSKTVVLNKTLLLRHVSSYMSPVLRNESKSCASLIIWHLEKTWQLFVSIGLEICQQTLLSGHISRSGDPTCTQQTFPLQRAINSDGDIFVNTHNSLTNPFHDKIIITT